MFVYGSLLCESWPDGLSCPAVISRMLMCVILLITEHRLYKSCHCHFKEVQPYDRSLIKNFCFERFNIVIIEIFFLLSRTDGELFFEKIQKIILIREALTWE